MFFFIGYNTSRVKRATFFRLFLEIAESNFGDRLVLKQMQHRWRGYRIKKRRTKSTEVAIMDDKCLVCNEDFEATAAGAIKPLTDSAFERINLGLSLLKDEEVCGRTAIVSGAGNLVDDEELRWALKQYLGDHCYQIQRTDSTRKGFEPGVVVGVHLKTTIGDYPVCFESALASHDELPDSLPPGKKRRVDY